MEALPLEAEIEDTFIGGAGFGYNFNDHVNINADIWFGPSDIRITFENDEIANINLSLWGMDFNIDYNILKKRITPLITGGIGFIYLYEYGNKDTFNLINDSETSLSYNLGAGLRWNISRDVAIKALYKNYWTEFDDLERHNNLKWFLFKHSVHILKISKL